MSDSTDEALSLFDHCAMRAYLEVWAETGVFPPDSETTKSRAYRYCEGALAEKNRHRPDS